MGLEDMTHGMQHPAGWPSVRHCHSAETLCLPRLPLSVSRLLRGFASKRPPPLNPLNEDF